MVSRVGRRALALELWVVNSVCLFGSYKGSPSPAFMKALDTYHLLSP